ncbi:MAG: transposase [Bacteroidales bacterium]|nr:transposase [Bacteroidales bacterium]
MSRNRKNIRLQGYDYSSKGLYFITICTKDREHYFGKIDNQKFEYSAIGGIAYTYWHEIPEHFTNLRLGEFIIMPNHIHGIIEIVSPPHGVDLQSSSELLAGTRHGVSPQLPKSTKNINEFGKTIPGSISTIIGQYKSSVTRWCNDNDFNFAWQSRFHDHIIRNEPEYNRIEQYIANNVANWREDKFFK